MSWHANLSHNLFETTVQFFPIFLWYFLMSSTPFLHNADFFNITITNTKCPTIPNTLSSPAYLSKSRETVFPLPKKGQLLWNSQQRIQRDSSCLKLPTIRKGSLNCLSRSSCLATHQTLIILTNSQPSSYWNRKRNLRMRIYRKSRSYIPTLTS